MLPNGNLAFTSGYLGIAPNYFGQTIEVLPDGTKTFVQQMTGLEYRSLPHEQPLRHAPPTSSTPALNPRSWGRAHGFRYDPTGSTWSFSGTAGVSGNDSAFTSGNPNAPQGSQVAFLQETGTASQSVNFALAGTYQISFSAAQRGNYITSHETVQVLVDGTVVGTIHPRRHQLRHLHDRLVQRDGRLATPSPSSASIPAGPTTPPSSIRSTSTTPR